MTTAVRSPVTLYADSVVAGSTVACKWVRLACERHLRDLTEAGARGFYFDEDDAQWSIDFFPELLKHSKGEWAGQALVLAPWEQFIVGCVFGWKRIEDGTRRFRLAFIELPRKNGKSTLAAGVGIKLAFFDDEPGAEVYAAATKRDQAKIVWAEGRQMVLKSPNIRRRVRVLKGNLNDPISASKFEPLGADSDSTDGLNIHGWILDELHAHKTRAMWDVLETATGARRQPLGFVITTAGHDRDSVCYEQHDYGCKVLEGIIEDDTCFIFIATIDDGDDPFDPASWAKANPNYGISVKPDDLERKAAKAQKVPGQLNAFLQLHLNVWTQVSTRWLTDEVWQEGAVEPPESLTKKPCFVGIAAPTARDFGALVLWFPDDAGGGDVLPFFWVPEEARRETVSIEAWTKEGSVTLVDGETLDHDLVREKLNELADEYEIREVVVLRYSVDGLMTQLMGDGYTVLQASNSYAAMSSPTKAVEKMLIEGKLRHGGNPVLRWMASSMAVRHGPDEQLRPDSEKSSETIVGMTALIMAVGRASQHEDKPAWSGIYISGASD